MVNHPSYSTTEIAEIRLTRRSPAYWRVTFDLPPLNIWGPKNVPQLNEIITALETDEHVKVVVFDSAIEGFFLTHYGQRRAAQVNSSLPVLLRRKTTSVSGALTAMQAVKMVLLLASASAAFSAVIA